MMNDISSFAFSAPTEDGRDGNGARRLYNRAVRDGLVSRLLASLTRKAHRLLDLRDVERDSRVRARHYLGLKTVEIKRIRGSEGRTGDFDAAFYPLDKSTADRWQSVATARYRDLALPAIDLILVGDTYYVRDGHHRISVAAARGELYIEARVTAWELDEPTPAWQPGGALPVMGS